MGNICGKGSKSEDNFSQPGRTLGSAPAQNARAPVPNRATKPPPKVKGPGRTVGASGTGQGDSDVADPKTAAARAAEQRAQNAQSKSKGKLSEQLAAQKKQTRTNTLEQASKDNRAARDADAANEARQWN